MNNIFDKVANGSILEDFLSELTLAESIELEVFRLKKGEIPADELNQSERVLWKMRRIARVILQGNEIFLKNALSNEGVQEAHENNRKFQRQFNFADILLADSLQTRMRKKGVNKGKAWYIREGGVIIEKDLPEACLRCQGCSHAGMPEYENDQQIGLFVFI